MSSIFSQEAIKFTKKLLAQSKTSPDVSHNFCDEIDKLTLNIISLAGFGYDVGAQGLGEANPFLSALQEVFVEAAKPRLMVPYIGYFMKWQNRRILKTVNDVLYRVIDERIQERLEGRQDSGRVADLLDMMMKPGDDGQQLTREELRNELVVFYLAGHETAANILNWTLVEVVRHPEVYANLMDEINSAMGPTGDEGVVCPTLDQLQDMPYLELVLNETLRLYAPFGSVNRVVPETFEHKGFVYPKGMAISSSILLIHRDPELWPEPEKFIPERHTKANSAERHPFAFFPFSGGQRICIGKNFFFAEAKILLVTMLRSLKFEVDQSKPLAVLTSQKGLLKPSANWLKVSSVM